LGALALGSVLDVGSLNITKTGDGCWHKVQPENRTFDSKEELRDYASEIGVDIPSNITFKTINGTLYQEAECIGGSGG